MPSSPASIRIPGLAVVAVVLLVVAASACGKDEFADRTARVVVDGRSETYQVDSCGLDGETLYVVGRSDAGSVLQLAVGLPEAVEGGVLDEVGVPDSTGVTVDVREGTVDPVRYAAFGEESWARRGEPGSPPGSITSARAQGSRIQVSARAAVVDARDRPVDPTATAPLSIDARCDAPDEDA